MSIMVALKTANTVRKFLKFMKTRYRLNLEETLKDTHHNLRVIRASKMRVGELRNMIDFMIRKIERIKELELKEEKHDERH